MAKNHAAIIPRANAQFEVVERAVPKPAADEVVVRVRAAAVNPLDWKIQSYNIFCETYPMVLGTDAAGEVVEVGSNVKLLKAGDRVLGFAGSFSAGSADHGAFQEYALLKEYNATKIPEQLSFEDASVLPTGIATAGMSLFFELGIPRIQGGQPSVAAHEGFLVWGGSGAMGVSAIQVAKAAGFMVYATASSGHHANLKTLGADYCFDYKAADVVQQIANATKSHGDHINFGFDSVSDGKTQIAALEILAQARNGQAKLGMTQPFPDDAKVLEGTDVKMTNALFISQKEHAEFASWLFHDWAASAIQQGKLKPAPAVQIEGHSVHDVQNALNVQQKGVSGKKIVVSF